MARAAKMHLSRQLLAASLVFVALFFAVIALFGWLIFRSLSQREVENVLLETRVEAESLAKQIARQAERQGKDLFTAVAVEQETQTYIDSILRQRDFVRTVEIRDRNGVLVYESHSRASLPVGPRPPLVPRSPELPGQHPGELPSPSPRIEHKTWEKSSATAIPDIQVPIGDLGSLQIGISAGELAKRIEVLRGELIRQATLIGVASVVLLAGAYTAVWMLLRRARRLELQAAEAERLAYIGTLASGLAHEIRSPLNSLNLNMQMLEEELAEQAPGTMPTGRRLLSITRSEIDRLERLATDFLAYAKPRALELAETPAVLPLERLREVLAGEIEKRGARVNVEDRSGGARVRIDPGQIDQLLMNLAQNALAAAEEAGRPPVLTLTAWRRGGAVVLEVLDNGIGIPAGQEAKIFDLFYSTRKGGTGLGLAIVQRIARAHGGTVQVKSAPGVGTAVSLELPAVTAIEPAPRPALKPSPIA
ncbi:MAG TPA: ATP-binding protein [Thermoanaerobaculia bacterium]|jgi:signal transduction histidine kinase|nr:ATP-binding protein [Thermoanaerobaculia bacterium]